MRTTLTLDDDLAATLKEQAKSTDQSFKKVVNDTLRRGLSPALPQPERDYTVRTFQSEFMPGVDPLRLNRLNDQIETEDFLVESAER